MFTVDFGDFNDRNVERAASEVVDGDFLVALLLVHAKGERRRRWFVDDALDFEAGDTPSILCRLTLAVVEVGGNGDDCFSHFLAKVVLGGFLHFAQHFG